MSEKMYNHIANIITYLGFSSMSLLALSIAGYIPSDELDGGEYVSIH